MLLHNLYVSDVDGRLTASGRQKWIINASPGGK